MKTTVYLEEEFLVYVGKYVKGTVNIFLCYTVLDSPTTYNI